MRIDGEKWRAMLLSVSGKWKDNSRYLCEIDAALGDGDHGVTMEKIGFALEEALRSWDGRDIGGLMSALGSKIMGIPGGSAASLYGVFIGGLGEPAAGKDEIDAAGLLAMIENALAELSGISGAKPGDKTMMDALAPAVDKAREADGGISAMLKAAMEASAAGAADTKNYAAKFGRAKNYREKSIGPLDAGAVSMSMFFQGMYEGFMA